MQFLHIFSADWYKTKRTGNLLISILLPVLVTLFVASAFAYRAAGGSTFQGEGDAWTTYSQIILTLYTMLLPFFVALVTFSMSNIEHKNNGLKQIFTLPVSKLQLYFSKVVVLLIWVGLATGMAYICLILGGHLLGAIFPNYGFAGSSISLPLGSFYIRTLFTLFALLAIHFFLGIYWNNFIISIGIACFMMVIAMVAFRWEYSYLVPYCSLFSGVEDYMTGVSKVFTSEIIANLIYGIAFLAIGYFSMLKKSIR